VVLGLVSQQVVLEAESFAAVRISAEVRRLGNDKLVAAGGALLRV